MVSVVISVSAKIPMVRSFTGGIMYKVTETGWFVGQTIVYTRE